MPNLPAPTLLDFATRLFVAAGVPEADARSWPTTWSGPTSGGTTRTGSCGSRSTSTSSARGITGSAST